MDNAMRALFTEDARTKPPPPLSNEIFGLIIESLGEDIPSLRTCSLVSSVFRHFCNPVLYRDIELDCKGKLDTFFQFGESSNSLRYTKSLSLTFFGFEIKSHLRKPRKILDIISQKVLLETLRLHHVQFQAEPFATSLLSKLSTVTTLDLQQCYFGGFEDLVSFIRCFPRCQILRLDGCAWPRGFPNLKFGRLPAYDLALTHLEVTTWRQGGRFFSDQGQILGMPWLNLAGLKSFTCAIPLPGDTPSRRVMEYIATCEALEELEVRVIYRAERDFAITWLTPFIARIKSLTLRCYSELLPWWSSISSDPLFLSSPTLERIKIVTPGPFPMIEGCRILDNTFSDTDRYPSLVQFEMCSPGVGAKNWVKGRYKHERLNMDDYFPRLRALGKLPARSTRSVESVRPIDTFVSVADAYYKDPM